MTIHTLVSHLLHTDTHTVVFTVGVCPRGGEQAKVVEDDILCLVVETHRHVGGVRDRGSHQKDAAVLQAPAVKSGDVLETPVEAAQGMCYYRDVILHWTSHM